jgi:hypothetical protein
MPSSPTDRPATIPAELAQIAARLTGSEILSARFCGGGGNNRVFRIETAHGLFALKSYGFSELDDRDRLGHEFDGLRFLKSGGIGSSVPSALAVDRTARCALYEWVEGTVPVDHSAQDIDAVLLLLNDMHHMRTVPGAEDLPSAVEAVLSSADIIAQIDKRIARFHEVCESEPELAEFLATELEPELRRRLGSLGELEAGGPLAQTSRTLSPSDFGFHNALRKADGSLVFIDFEYFGWDDPVKLTSDFLWHPAMHLSDNARQQFLKGAVDLYAPSSDGFERRLDLFFPLFGIRWALIMLNEFLPQLWERREFSGRGHDWAATKAEQLRKAREKLRMASNAPLGSPPKS